MNHAALKLLHNYSDGRLRQETIDWAHNILEQEALPTNVLLVLFHQQGRLVGMFGCEIENGETEKSFIVVNNYCRGNGLGSEILDTALALLKSRKAKFKAWVSSRNEPSIKLLKKRGFEILKEEILSRASNGEPYTAYLFGEKS